MTERERQLAYIERELARGDRDPADVKILRERREALLAARRKEAGG